MKTWFEIALFLFLCRPSWALLRNSRAILRPSRLYKQDCDYPGEVWENLDVVPPSYDAAKTMLLNSLYSGIQDGKEANAIEGSMASIDLLTPGLNPKLEQKVILSTELMFDVVQSMLPVLSSSFSTTFLMFQSMGDAAGFVKYMKQTQGDLPRNVVATELNSRYFTKEVAIECVVFIKASNNVGDPVLREVRHIVENTSPKSAYFYLNCDLSDKVTTGSTSKNERDDFRSRITPLFYFRNIVSVSRPSLLPREKGALLFTPSKGWTLYRVNDKDIFGSGSLNRFLEKAVFKRNERDPTAVSPPRFIKCASFQNMPKRDEIDSAISKGDFLLAKRIRDLERAKKKATEAEVKEENPSKGWFKWF